MSRSTRVAVDLTPFPELVVVCLGFRAVGIGGFAQTGKARLRHADDHDRPAGWFAAARVRALGLDACGHASILAGSAEPGSFHTHCAAFRLVARFRARGRGHRFLARGLCPHRWYRRLVYRHAAVRPRGLSPHRGSPSAPSRPRANGWPPEISPGRAGPCPAPVDWIAAAISSSSGGDRISRAPPTQPSTCCGLRAPTIAPVTAGHARTQAIATAGTGT